MSRLLVVCLLAPVLVWGQAPAYTLVAQWHHAAPDPAIVYFELGWRTLPAAEIGTGTPYAFGPLVWVQPQTYTARVTLPPLGEGDLVAFAVRACNVYSDACSEWTAERRLFFTHDTADIIPLMPGKPDGYVEVR